jgi:hypothetical protein
VSRPLCEASAREHARRTWQAFRVSPLLGLALLVGWLAAPYAASRLGAELAAALGGALGDAEAVRALAVGCALSAAAAGAAVGAGTPAPRAFGLQVVAAPVGRAALVVAAGLPTVIGGALLVAPAVASGTIGFTAHAEPITPDAAAALASLAGLAVVGALVTEGGATVRRDTVLGASSLAAAAVAWAALERSLEHALAGHTAPVLLALGSAAALACAAAWVALRARRPLVRCQGRTIAIPRRLLAGRRRAVVVAAGGILGRAADLRVALVAATAFGLFGVAIGVALVAPLAAAAVLGGGAAALTAAIVPLSVRGRIDTGAWTWRAVGRTGLALGWAVGALGLTLLAVAPALLIGVARPAALGASGYVASLTWFCCAAALIAGAVIPRRSSRLGDDAASLAALLVVAFALGAVVSAAGPRLEGSGVPAPAVVSLLALATGAVAVGVVAVALGRR